MDQESSGVCAGRHPGSASNFIVVGLLCMMMNVTGHQVVCLDLCSALAEAIRLSVIGGGGAPVALGLLDLTLVQNCL